jgi:hypothetical protein
MLFVTFHDDDAGAHNVAAYDDRGRLSKASVLEDPILGEAELRGLSFAPDGALWVLNGSAQASQILRYTGSGTSYRRAGVIASYPSLNSLWHPFDLAFTAQGTPRLCYVSNQDTDVVAYFALTPDFKGVTPLPPPPALPSGGKFLTGTFAAASACQLPGVQRTTPVRQLDGGLDVTVELLEHKDKAGAWELQEKVTHSVRGVLWNGQTLYVADEPGNAIKLYNASGYLLGQTEPIEAPVHLCVRSETYKGKSVETLYASGEPGVFCATLPLPAKPGSKRIFTFSSEPLIEQKGASGIAFGPTTLYAGARRRGEIYAYESFSREAKEHPHKPFSVLGSPEFILYVPGTSAPD